MQMISGRNIHLIMQKPCSGKFKAPCPRSHSSSSNKSECTHPPLLQVSHRVVMVQNKKKVHVRTVPCSSTVVGKGLHKEKKYIILLKAPTKSHLGPYYWVTKIKAFILFDLTWGGKREDKPSKPSWKKELTVATNFSKQVITEKVFSK